MFDKQIVGIGRFLKNNFSLLMPLKKLGVMYDSTLNQNSSWKYSIYKETVALVLVDCDKLI